MSLLDVKYVVTVEFINAETGLTDSVAFYVTSAVSAEGLARSFELSGRVQAQGSHTLMDCKVTRAVYAGV